MTYFNGEYFFEYENLKGRLQLACKSVKQEYSFTIEDLVDDLVVSIPIIIKDGMEYKFPHRSLQEYFAASFISSLDIESKAKVYQEKAI
ncbi:MAG: hypothetical protein IPM36_09460 [Lewinellaceae bacterium]|nr:hypothetical protein [Lewinellaceae bacterium]